MDKARHVAVIGAGITGIACAGLLQTAGLRVRLYDKGRGIGGRMATRRAEGGLRFDHGAQYLRPRETAFATLLTTLATPWPDGPPGMPMIGTPGMSDLPRAMARDLEVVQDAMVTGLRRDGAGWRLRIGDRDHHADLVVLAIPAPQARDLLGADHPLSADLAQVRYHANVTLMAGLDPLAPRPFVTRRGSGALAWIAQDSAKPGRAGQPLTTWVVQAAPDWSLAHIDLPFAELARMIAPQLLETLGADAAHLRHKAAHRWLYAQTDRALGRPFLADDGTGLIVGGDWALGPLAEDGWASGRAMAAHLSGRHGNG